MKQDNYTMLLIVLVPTQLLLNGTTASRLGTFAVNGSISGPFLYWLVQRSVCHVMRVSLSALTSKPRPVR